jgi:3-oxoacyl-[acyl-carrier-protein] synthase-1
MTACLSQPLVLTAVGAVSAVGATATQTCAAIRGGLAGFAEHPFFESLPHDPEWEPGVDPAAEGEDRLVELAAPALVELGRSAGLRRADLPRTALLVALPALDGCVEEWGLEGSFVSRLQRVTGLSEIGFLRTRHAGHTGVFALVEEAQRMLTSGEHQFCILLGVDSFLSPDRMELWDEAWRLRSERNVDGFVPGEAASALLLELPERAQERSARVLAKIEALGFGLEPNPQSGAESSTGAGLCEVLGDVIPPDRPARWVCCDLNGESYRAFEWGLAQVRLASALEGLRLLDHPADCTGDVGAATGGLLVSHVAHGFARSRTVPHNAALWAADDDGHRAALRLAAASGA